MVLEEYCSFETAKLLKEKGFDAELKMYWSMGTSDIPILHCCPQHPVDDGEEPMPIEIDNSGKECTNRSNPWKPEEFECIAPTLQMACRWLRKVHHIHVCPEYKAFFQERPKKIYHHWCNRIVGIDRYFKRGIQDVDILDSDYFYYHDAKTYHDSYEEACEECIRFALENLITE